MQFSSQGQWGKGLYFARDAGYSDFYATVKTNQLLLGSSNESMISYVFPLGKLLPYAASSTSIPYVPAGRAVPNPVTVIVYPASAESTG